MPRLHLTDEQISALLAQAGLFRDPAGCDHAVAQPTGGIWDAPGHPIHEKQSHVCADCETSRTLRVTPFVWPILKKVGE
ncbi:MAG: hypothetical protein WCV85_05490 [Patescibacteria group bacterium]|jgi:hypothetical protein